MDINQLYWREPLLLLLALAPIVVIGLVKWRQSHQWHSIADQHLLPWLKNDQPSSQQFLSITLLSLSWILLVIALAGPRTVLWFPPEVVKKENALVIVIDSSASMGAVDQQPSRKEYGLNRVTELLKMMPNGLDIGISLFAGTHHVLLAPTFDHNTVSHSLQQVSSIELPALGNRLDTAITEAKKELLKYQDQRYIILLTDGDADEKMRTQAVKAAINLINDNISLIVLATGGHEAVALPALRHDSVNTQLRDSNGRIVVSRQNSQWLKSLATTSKGVYLDLARTDNQAITNYIQLLHPVIEPEMYNKVVWKEWFFIPLLAAIACLLIALNKPALRYASLIMLSATIFPASDSFASSASTTSDYLSSFNTATDCYRNKDYTCAFKGFSDAAWLSDSDAQRGAAVFNLGNTQFRLGLYDDASTSFRDAGLWGVDITLIEKNLGYSESLAKAVKKQLAELIETEKRAEFRAQRAQSDNLLDNERSTITRHLLRPKHLDDRLQVLPHNLTQSLITNGLKQSTMESSHKGWGWIATDHNKSDNSAAELNMRLFEMELGIPARQKNAFLIEGQRAW